jgi:iron-sulfur cluster assembly accessory protein
VFQRLKALNEQSDDKDKVTFLRVEIDAGGCSEYQYKFSLESELEEDDTIIEEDGARIVVDRMSIAFLEGSTVNFKDELASSTFEITDNPLSVGSCGCGTSFATSA